MPKLQLPIGFKNNHLVLIEHLPVEGKSRHQKTMGLFQCICGKKVKRSLYVVSAGVSKTCGCTFALPIGWKNNKLTLLKYLGRKRTPKRLGASMGLFKCDCGKEVETQINYVISGHSRGCRGCGLGYLPYGVASFRRFYKGYISGAKTRKIKFNLTEDQFRKITSSNCYYCNCKPAMIQQARESRNGDYIHNGIDRVDSSKSYTLDNCVPCCGFCNTAKLDYTMEEFIKKCHAICSVHPLKET